MTFDALSAADLLTATPTLIVHGRVDAYCSPDLAEAMHTRIPNPDKQFVWLDATEHIDLYDVEPHVAAAVSATVAFLDKHL
ncbi:hypothetical protein ACFQV2_31910 [Actinokineospora soli]|uniref:Uncharacterized protein n=1 Tax=Actinokineospora soli TaxID=1048753 RepID=A0ABW2TU12_9PSEU